MRLVRLGPEATRCYAQSPDPTRFYAQNPDVARFYAQNTASTEVSADMRAALAACGSGDSVLGGVALLGYTPPGCQRPLDALLVLPRGVVVVIGTDLPHPALRLDAPLRGTWVVDGWPLVRSDGMLNPAHEALQVSLAVTQHMHSMRVDLLPVSTLIAVGPFVERVFQPSADLSRGVRVLHPTPTSVLTAARELATAAHPCSVEQVHQLLNALADEPVALRPADLAAEGFPDAVTADIASASTLLIPRIPDYAHNTAPTAASAGRATHAGRPSRQGQPVRPGPPLVMSRRRQRWLALTVAGVVAMLALMLVGLGVGDDAQGPDAAQQSPASNSDTSADRSAVESIQFVPKRSVKDISCVERSFGSVQTWLAQRPCIGLIRGLFQAEVTQRKAAVSIAVVSFEDKISAAGLHQLVGTANAGNILPLMGDPGTWPDGPQSFAGAAHATSRNEERVRIVQAVWLGEPSRPDDVALRNLAQRALSIPLPG